jgi:hypothetical protein
MPIDEELLKQVRENPADVRFTDIVKLAKQMGWEPVGGKGSHTVFKHPNGRLIRNKFPIPLNLQEGKDGKAKAYQVEQLLDMALELGIIKMSETKE